MNKKVDLGKEPLTMTREEIEDKYGKKYGPKWDKIKKEMAELDEYVDSMVSQVDELVEKGKNNVMHGQGTYNFADGGKYVGEWKDGMKHGQGTYNFADGGKYVGGFKNDVMHGQGTYNFADGAKYVGGYKDGEMHGQGTATFSDGSIERGIWKNGELETAN